MLSDESFSGDVLGTTMTGGFHDVILGGDLIMAYSVGFLLLTVQPVTRDEGGRGVSNCLPGLINPLACVQLLQSAYNR